MSENHHNPDEGEHGTEPPRLATWQAALDDTAWEWPGQQAVAQGWFGRAGVGAVRSIVSLSDPAPGFAQLQHLLAERVRRSTTPVPIELNLPRSPAAVDQPRVETEVASSHPGMPGTACK
jgi:hypothetical protein